MDTVLSGLREILGSADFYITSGDVPYWDYAAMIEYFTGAVILCIVVSSIFKILVRWSER